MLNDLPSGLQQLVRVELFKDVVQQSALFNSVDPQVYNQVKILKSQLLISSLFELTMVLTFEDFVFYIAYAFNLCQLRAYVSPMYKTQHIAIIILHTV